MALLQARVISLRNVTPSIPENPIHLEELKHDLATMRCEGLLERSWALKREQLVREMVQPERLNIFKGTIRDRPQLWTADLWRDTTFREEVPVCPTGWRATTKGGLCIKSTPRTGILWATAGTTGNDGFLNFWFRSSTRTSQPR